MNENYVYESPSESTSIATKLFHTLDFIGSKPKLRVGVKGRHKTIDRRISLLTNLYLNRHRVLLR